MTGPRPGLVRDGADVLVAGSFVFHHASGPPGGIAALRARGGGAIEPVSVSPAFPDRAGRSCCVGALVYTVLVAYPRKYGALTWSFAPVSGHWASVCSICF